MKVCLAQISSVPGDVARNVARHLAVLERLPRGAANLVAFPELSLSNYSPDLAGAVALAPDDPRLAPFQRFADAAGTAVAVGAPLRTAGKPHIALLVFAPGQQAPHVVGKRYLHADEEPFFAPYAAEPGVLDFGGRVGVAICYELSVAAHTAAVMAQGPALYLASVAKTAQGVAAALETLAATAARHGVPVLMVNCVGTCEGRPAGGGSAAFDAAGRLLARLSPTGEALLCFDTPVQTATTHALPGQAEEDQASGGASERQAERTR